MERGVALLVLLVLMTGMVYAVDDWSDIGSGDGAVDDPIINNSGTTDPTDDSATDRVVDSPASDGNSIKKISYTDALDSLFDSERYTNNFYLALGVGGIGILIILLFIYLFIRGPKNRFKKKVVKKKPVVKKGKRGKQKGKSRK